MMRFIFMYNYKSCMFLYLLCILLCLILILYMFVYMSHIYMKDIYQATYFLPVFLVCILIQFSFTVISIQYNCIYVYTYLSNSCTLYTCLSIPHLYKEYSSIYRFPTQLFRICYRDRFAGWLSRIYKYVESFINFNKKWENF